MPDKDGDEGKSTKSVVNKKQKQMMGEEGYDRLRDMGRVRPSKDKKDATTMPRSKEMEKTRKVNKGPSALDIVKKKYKGQIMKMEELDLTQVAEAFGGYIVEQTDQGKKNKNKNQSGGADYSSTSSRTSNKKYKNTQDNVKSGVSPSELAKAAALERKKEGDDAKEPPRKNVAMDPDSYGRFEPASGTGMSDDDGTVAPTIGKMKTRFVDPSTLRPGVNPTAEIKRGRPVGAKDKTQRYVAKSPSKKDEVLAAMTPGQRARNLRRIQKDIDAKSPTIETEVGKVPYRNRRVPKTSALVPQYDRTPKIMKPDTKVLNKLSPNVKTSFFQPTVGALPLTQTDFNKIVPFRRPTKPTYNDFINPEVVDPGGPKPQKGGALGVDTGPTVIGQVIKDKPTKKDIKKLKPPKIVGYIAPGKTKKSDPPEETTADPIGGDPPNNKTRVGNFSYRPGGPFSRIRGFARRNPALSLVGYDALKNLRAPSVTKPTKTGRVSAGS